LRAADPDAAAAALAQLVTAGIRVYSFQQQTTNLSELTLKALGHKPQPPRLVKQ
jgi:hypothetical protein